MDALVAAYVVYLVAAIGLTAIVGTVLSKQGKAYLADVFGSDTSVAHSVNQLLLLGFYLVSFGFIALTLSTDAELGSAAAVIELLAVKLGVVALGLGALHMTNIAVFNRIRHRRQEEVLHRNAAATAHRDPAAYPATPAVAPARARG